MAGATCGPPWTATSQVLHPPPAAAGSGDEWRTLPCNNHGRHSVGYQATLLRASTSSSSCGSRCAAAKPRHEICDACLQIKYDSAGTLSVVLTRRETVRKLAMSQQVEGMIASVHVFVVAQGSTAVRISHTVMLRRIRSKHPACGACGRDSA